MYYYANIFCIYGARSPNVISVNGLRVLLHFMLLYASCSKSYDIFNGRKNS